MSFADLARDILTLIKKDGSTVEGIKAIVTPKQIIVPSRGKETLPVIDPEDLVQRKMSNGAEEVYVVNNPQFFEAMKGIPTRYQLDVRKLGVPEAKRAIQNITYNVTGDNARINQNTTDQSVNVTQRPSSDVANLLEDLRQEIKQCVENQLQRSEALEVTDAIEDQFKSSSPSKTVVEVLARGLPPVGNIASTASLLLQCLASFR